MASATRNYPEPRIDGIRRQVGPLGGPREYIGRLLHRNIVLNLVLVKLDICGNLTTVARLAAIAIEYGAELCHSIDYRRFNGLVFRPLGI